MNSQTLFVTENEKGRVDQLRMQEYAKASGFAVELTTLKWKQSDNESYVMVAESNGEFVSTMRGEIITDISLLEKKLECPWEFDLDIQLPVLLLSRAATVSEYRNSGLNLILRYWFLKLAQHHHIPFVVGTFVAGSARENTLRQMGYQFFENKLGWQQSTYRSLKPVQVVALDMKKHSEHAIQYCIQNTANGIHEFSFSGPFPELKTVTCI